MATKKITFDPEAGVAYPCDLTLNVGADFTANELPSFKSFRINFLMTSTNQAFVPRLTSLKVIATA